MTVKLSAIRIIILLSMFLIGLIAPVFAQNLDGVKEVLKGGFERQSLPLRTDWGSIESFVSSEDRLLEANNIKPFGPLGQSGFKNYLMSKDSTQACRFLVELSLFTSCPPLEIALVNPQNITEFIIISKEVKAGYISKSHIEKTLLPGILKKQEEMTGEETDNGIITTTALIEPPSFVTKNVIPHIAFRTQITINNGIDVLRYYEQHLYILTRNGYVGIVIINTKLLEKDLIDQLIERIIDVPSPNGYFHASMFDFNTSNIKAEDFLIFE